MRDMTADAGVGVLERHFGELAGVFGGLVRHRCNKSAWKSAWRLHPHL